MELDLKLTRTEAIGIVIDELREEVQLRAAAANLIYQNACQKFNEAVESLTVADLKNMEVGDISHHFRDYGSKKNKWSFSLTFYSDPDKLPKKLRALAEEMDAARIASEEAREQLREFNSNRDKVKNKLLRTALAQTKEGVEFLKKIDVLKITVAKQLLLNGDK